MTRSQLVVLSIVALGCGVPQTRELSPSDRADIAAAQDAWSAARGETSCEALRHVTVHSLPDPELECGSNLRFAHVTGCSFAQHAWPWEPARLTIVVGDLYDRRALIVHETLHALRGCWVNAVRADDPEWLRRLNYGETSDCDVPDAPDSAHCDVAVWSAIENAAVSGPR